MDERQELRRLIPRTLVAAVLAIFTAYIQHELKSADPKTGRAFAFASKLNKFADMCFAMVTFRIAISL